MATYLLAVPLVPGKTEVWKKYNQEMEGPRRQEYQNFHTRLGIRVEQVALQQTPNGDMVIVHWEADNPQKIFDTFKDSQERFDKWFREKIIIECHNMDLSQPMPKMTQVHDYHETPSREYAETKKNR
jgi:hypothetical protein